MKNDSGYHKFTKIEYGHGNYIPFAIKAFGQLYQSHP